jgi:hypothetical protein
MPLATSPRQQPIEVELPAPTTWPMVLPTRVALPAGVVAPGILPPRGKDGGRP